LNVDAPKPDGFTRPHFLLGAVFLGLQFGDWNYYLITGLRPPNAFMAFGATSLPWMLFFGGMRVAIAIVTSGFIRLGWVVAFAALLLSWVGLVDGPGLSSWLVREALMTLSASLFIVGGISGARSFALRVLALAMIVAVIPFRYYTAKHWDDVTGRTTIMSRDWPFQEDRCRNS
jgi:hypothetical protein